MDYKRIMEESYNLQVDSISLIDSHFGTEIYKVAAGCGRYILKSFPGYMGSAGNEGFVTEYLLKKGLKVPRFLQTPEERYSAATGERIVTVQEFVEGVTLQVNSAPGWFVDESARLLGKMNAALRNYAGLHLSFGPDFFMKDTVMRKKRQYESELAAARKKDDADVVARYEDQIRHLSKISGFFIDTAKLTYANSHGDYHIGQAIINGDEITIVDWASACRLPVCLEVITSYVFASPECKDGAIDIAGLKSYINHYGEYSSLSEYDISAMPYVLYFWHCMCNYSPQEKMPDGYKPTARLINNMLNWLCGNVEALSRDLSTAQ